jgi:hypothetical protein
VLALRLRGAARSDDKSRAAVAETDIPAGSTSVAPPQAAQPSAADSAVSGHHFATKLNWNPGLDERGMIRRFPTEFDAAGRGLPILLAVFDKNYLLRIILPKAKAGLGPEASELLGLNVDEDEVDDDTLRSNAIHLYTRPEIYVEVNRLMRLDIGRNEPTAPLWPFIAILQMAFIKREKDSTGGAIYRGGLIELAQLTEIRRAISAGHDAEVMLKGITSCSRSEAIAMGFAERSTPTSALVRVMWQVSLKQVDYTVNMKAGGALPYGPATSVEQISKYAEENEVILLDGTVLKVSPGDIVDQGRIPFTNEAGRYNFECVQIKARVDWDELGNYFALCDQARK